MLGHTNCGAIAAAVDTRLRGTRQHSRIQILVDSIVPGLTDLDPQLNPETEDIGIPHCVYNIPGRSAKNIEPETIAKLSELPNITMVKEATGSLDQCSQILLASLRPFVRRIVGRVQP